MIYRFTVCVDNRISSCVGEESIDDVTDRIISRVKNRLSLKLPQPEVECDKRTYSPARYTSQSSKTSGKQIPSVITDNMASPY